MGARFEEDQIVIEPLFKLFFGTNGDESIDGEPLVDEVDLAALSEWDPVLDQGKYCLIEGDTDEAGWEEYLMALVFDGILETYQLK